MHKWACNERERSIMKLIIKGLLGALLVTNAILFADDAEDEPENNASDTGEGTSKLSEEVYQPRPAASAPTYLAGDWGGHRTALSRKGIDFGVLLVFDDSWNLSGGKHRSHTLGEYEYLLDVSFRLTSDPLLHYTGGTFFTSFESHHWKNPSTTVVGAFVPIDTLEAPGFDELYSLWYKQAFQNNKYWVMAGKSDAYDNFTIIPHASAFINSGYTFQPTILFFPTYPDPAMSIVGFVTIPYNIFLTLGVFDGSLAEGYHTGKHGVIGKFFNNLPKHAFLIGEVDYQWELIKNFSGRLGIAIWKHTAEFTKFNGGTQKGTWGPCITFDQIIYKKDKEEGAFFATYSSSDPSLNAAQRYIAVGATWNGARYGRSDDVVGIGMSRVNFTQDPDAGFTEHYEASFEAFYKLSFAKFGLFEPDFQYIVHPGGKGLENAWVFTLRLQVDL